jgi:integrase
MGRTRTSGITTDKCGGRIIKKEVLGKTIYRRLGVVAQEVAEQILAREVERIRLAREKGSRPRVAFREASVKYLKDEAPKLASCDDLAWHVELLDPFIGDLALEEVHDETLRPFKESRLKRDGVGMTTVNRSLEVVRRILNLCARKWRHPNGMSWLETVPLIEMERNTHARKPYPLSWEEQALLFGELRYDPNGQMALFKVNTGLREQEVCNLRWDWEAEIPELGTSVFIVPAIFSDDGLHGVKNREDRLVVMNDVARSVVEARRGIHPEYVFTCRGKKLNCMNNTAWQNARKDAADKYMERFGKEAPWGFAHIRIHDLKHTFGRRLRAARVPFETRQVLLGHKNGSITTHYSATEIGELIEGVNRIDASRSTPILTTLRVVSAPVPGKSAATAEALQSVAGKKLGHPKVA